MFADNVVPHVLLDEVVGSEEQHEEYYYAKPCEEDVHPLFVQEVDGWRSFAALRMT